MRSSKALWPFAARTWGLANPAILPPPASRCVTRPTIRARIRTSAQIHVQAFVQGLNGHGGSQKALVRLPMRRSTIDMEWVSYISVIITAPVIVGLSAWLGKIWAGRILEKDRARYQTNMETLLAALRTTITKELLVHQLQFQKEFEVYKELWVAALGLARAGSNFRMLQMGPQASPDEISLEIETSYARLRDAVFDNRPFYEPEVYEAAKAMLNGLGEVVRKRKQLERLEQGDMSDKKVEKACSLDKEIEQKLDEIDKVLEKLCTSIRSRIWSTTASGWDRPCDQ